MRYTYLIFFLLITSLWSCNVDGFLGSTNALSKVPETALAGAYINDLDQLNSLLDGSDVIKESLREILDQQQAGFLMPDSLKNWLPSIDNFTISWHTVSGDELAPLAILNFTNPINEPTWSDMFQGLFSTAGTTKSKLFDDRQIWLQQQGEKEYAWMLSNGSLAISTSALLIEDVVRSETDESFRLIEQNDLNINGNKLFLNGARYNELSAKFSKGNSSFPVKEVMLLDLELSQDGIRISGETVTGKPGRIQNELLFGQSFIPLEAESLSWSFKQENADDRIDDFYTQVKLEIFDQKESLYILDVKEASSLTADLNQNAQASLKTGDSTIYQEQYASEIIGFIADDYFQQLMNESSGYLKDGAYYCQVDGVLLVSPSSEMIRRSLAAHFDEATYGQSVEKRAFIDGLIQDSYFTSITNFEASEIKDDQLKPLYAELFRGWMNKLSYSALQINSTSNNYLISGSLGIYNEVKRDKTVTNNANDLMANVFLDTTSVTKAYITNNHNTGQREIVLQDGKDQLYQANLQGNVNWKRNVGAEIRSNIVQIDYYNNRKLQYLFATDSLLHIIDRNGEDVDGFPKPHGIRSKINGLEVVDYDNTKRYRYLISAGRGDIYLFDKEGNQLEGWAPRKIDAVVPTTPYHSRVAGKDFFIVVERSNNIHLLNRRGEEYDGFPLDLKQRISGDHYFKRSPSLATSEIVTISDDGLRTRVNLLGKVLEQKQYLKENNDDSYRLVNDLLGNGYLVLRTDRTTSHVFGVDDQALFQIPRINNSTQLSFYRLSGGRSVLMSWDSSTGAIVLYDMKGRVLAKDVRSTDQPSLLYYSREGNYQLFTNFDNQVRIYQYSAID